MAGYSLSKAIQNLTFGAQAHSASAVPPRANLAAVRSTVTGQSLPVSAPPTGTGLPIANISISQLYDKLTVDSLATAFKVEDIDEAIKYLEGLNRPLDQYGKPGMLVEEDLNGMIIGIGDIHGNEKRLDLVRAKEDIPYNDGSGMSLPSIYEALINNHAKEVFLGDLIHREETNKGNSVSSLRILQSLIKLMSLPISSTIYLRGNHEVIYTDERYLDMALDFVFDKDPESAMDDIEYRSFISNRIVSENLKEGFESSLMAAGKPGYPQALLFLRDICRYYQRSGCDKTKVKKIVKKYQKFIDSLPAFMLIHAPYGDIYLSHAGIKKGGLTKEQLINARYNGLLTELLTSRPTIPGGKIREYDIQGVQDTAKGLGATRIFIGHVPNENQWIYQPYPELAKDSITFGVIHGNVNSFGVLTIDEDGLNKVEDFDLQNAPAT